MSLQKHNRWSRVIPLGFTCTDLKNHLRLTTLIERERSICRLVLDTAEPEFFTLTVKFIADSIGFSAAKQWPKVRDLLVQKGILACNAEELGGGQQRWHLNFDFTPLASGLFDRKAEKLSTPDAKKGGSRARACDPPNLGGSRDPSKSGGSRDPSTNGGLEPEALEPAKPTSKAAAFLLLEKNKYLRAATMGDKNRIWAALDGADARQAGAFFGALEARLSRARSPVALSIHLAGLAARGELSIETTSEPAVSAAEICAAMACRRGHLRGPSGFVAFAQADAAPGQLRSPSGLLFSLADSAVFWSRVENGELDLVVADSLSPVS